MTAIVDTQTQAAEQEFLELFARGPERLTWSNLPPQVGDPAPALTLADSTRSDVSLPGLWAG